MQKPTDEFLVSVVEEEGIGSEGNHVTQGSGYDVLVNTVEPRLTDTPQQRTPTI